MKKLSIGNPGLALRLLPVAAALAVSLGSAGAWAQSATPERLDRNAVFPRLALDLLGIKTILSVDTAKAPGSQPVALHDLVNEALGYSLELQAARESTDAAMSSTEVARRSLMPRVDASLGTGANQYRSTSQPNSPVLQRSDMSITARQPIWDPALRAEVGRKASLEQATGYDSESAALRISGELVTAYLEVIRNRATVDITTDYEQTLKRLIAYLRKRAEGGASSIADLDRVKGREEGAKSRAIEARAGLAAASFALRRQLGRIPGEIALPVSIDMRLPESLDTAFGEASASSPDLRSARAQLDALSYELDGLRGRFMPKVELEVSNAQTRNASGTVGRTNDKKVMLTATMALWTSGADSLEMRASAQRRSALLSRTMHAERILRQDLEVAFSTLDAVRERINPAVLELEANARVARTYDDQLLLGGRSLLDLLDAYQRLYESRLGLLQLVVVDAQQKYNLVRLLGRLEQLKSPG